MWATARLDRALEDTARSSAILRNHMQADMMHDALRSDVLSAILASDPAAGVNPEEVRGDLAAHSKSFRDSMARNTKLVREPATRAALARVEAPLTAYVAAAESIVDGAGRDPAAATVALADFKDRFEKLEVQMEVTSDELEKGAAKNATDAKARAALGQGVVMATLILGVLFAVGLIVATLRTVVRPIQTLATDMQALADGRTDVAIEGAKRGDEVGAIGRAVGALQQVILGQLQAEAAEADRRRQIEAEAQARQQQEQQARAQAQFMVVEGLASGLNQLAAGDLAFRLTEPFDAEYDQLRRDFNAAMTKLEQTLRTIIEAAGAIRGSSGEIGSAANDLSRRTEQQAAGLEETAAALDEITATVRRTAEGAQSAQKAVNTSRSAAEQSGLVVNEAATAMARIEASSTQIGQITGVIDEIAFQTNLRALNAGVEAARAGDGGKGFAVFASEVRALAQRSAEAAKEIKTLIAASSSQVGRGVQLVNDTNATLGDIVSQVSGIYQLVTEISASAAEQATGLGQINVAVNQMDQMTQQNAAMVEQSTAASIALNHEVGRLFELVGQFRVGEAHEQPSDRSRRAA
ncbi:methyl-accepting chemotaxis protein [Phenylobacterium sp.]|uniref:methyl-accepting chemotaxis protein n=1 Tax=Phenylobacterium sp. TaxID=1871053 RepID=UPI00351DF694